MEPGSPGVVARASTWSLVWAVASEETSSGRTNSSPDNISTLLPESEMADCWVLVLLAFDCWLNVIEPAASWKSDDVSQLEDTAFGVGVRPFPGRSSEFWAGRRSAAFVDSKSASPFPFGRFDAGFAEI